MVDLFEGGEDAGGGGAVKFDGTKLSPEQFQAFEAELDALCNRYGVSIAHADMDNIYVGASSFPGVKYLYNGDDPGSIPE